MKTFRKALSIILGAAIMLSCLFGMQVSVAAEENALALSLGEATVADGVVTVPVKVDNNPGFQALTLEVGYEEAVLDLVLPTEETPVKNKDFTTEKDCAVSGPDVNPFRIMWAFYEAEADVTAEGTIATLTFNLVDADAEATDITLTVTEAWDVAGNEVAATTAEKETVDLVKEPVHTHNYTYEIDPEGHSKVCSNEDGLCDAVTTEKVVHDFDETTGLCECGLKLDSRLTIAMASLSFSDSSLDYNFRFLKTGVLDLYDDVTFVLTPDKYDVSTLNLVANPTKYEIHEDQYVSVSSRHMQYTYSDFFLYELALDIEYMFYAYDGGKLVAVSAPVTISPAEKIKSNITTNTNEKAKTAYTDLLVVCDEYMKVTGDSKPGSDLDLAPSILDGFDTSFKTQSVDTWEQTTTLEAINNEYGLESTAAHQIMVSVQTEKVPFFNLRIMDKTNVLDVNKLSIYVTYVSKDSKGEEKKEMTFTGADFKDAARYIELKFNKVGLHDSDKVISFIATYDGAPIFNYYRSMESATGAGQNAGNATDAAMKALLHFGQSFRTFMGI